MNIENIKALAEILSAHGLSLLEITEGGISIRMRKETSPQQTQEQPAAAVLPASLDADITAIAAGQSLDFNHLIEVKSPLIGVFYSAPSPDSETFVSIGSKIKKGDVLCIIETMKLMNEITAEHDGEIVDICIRNGDIAEFGQVLFKMYPR